MIWISIGIGISLKKQANISIAMCMWVLVELYCAYHISVLQNTGFYWAIVIVSDIVTHGGDDRDCVEAASDNVSDGQIRTGETLLETTSSYQDCQETLLFVSS